MPKSALYSAILTLLKSLELCNGMDTLPAWFQLHVDGELVIDATMLLCQYLRTMDSLVSWEDACALLVLTFIDNAERETAVLGAATAGEEAVALGKRYRDIAPPPRDTVDTENAVANVVEELKNKFAALIVRLYELGVPVVRVVFDGKTPTLKQPESYSRREFTPFVSAIDKAIDARGKNNLRGAVKHVLSVCTSSILVLPLVVALRGRFPTATSSFASSLTIGIAIGEVDALVAYRSKVAKMLGWMNDADTVFDGVRYVVRALDEATGAFKVGGYGIVDDPRHRPSLAHIDEIDVRTGSIIAYHYAGSSLTCMRALVLRQLLVTRVIVGDDFEKFWIQRGTPGHVIGLDCVTMLKEVIPALRKARDWNESGLVTRVRVADDEVALVEDDCANYVYTCVLQIDRTVTYIESKNKMKTGARRYIVHGRLRSVVLLSIVARLSAIVEIDGDFVRRVHDTYPQPLWTDDQLQQACAELSMPVDRVVPPAAPAGNVYRVCDVTAQHPFLPVVEPEVAMARVRGERARALRDALSQHWRLLAAPLRGGRMSVITAAGDDITDLLFADGEGLFGEGGAEGADAVLFCADKKKLKWLCSPGASADDGVLIAKGNVAASMLTQIGDLHNMLITRCSTARGAPMPTDCLCPAVSVVNNPVVAATVSQVR